MESIKKYIEELSNTFSILNFNEIEDLVRILEKAYNEDRNIFVIGNGGSAAVASHFTCDLSKGIVKNFESSKKRFRVQALTDNIPLISAYANDLGYDKMFAEQLKNLMCRGDLLIAVSSSGNSPNIVEAVKTAKENGLFVIGLSGFNGGKLKEMADHSIHVPKNHYGYVEDAHMIILHAATYVLKNRINVD